MWGAMNPTAALVLAAASAVVSATYITQSLASSPPNGSATCSWMLYNSEESIAVAATVPGCVHTDLLRSNVIAEPFAEENVDLQRWVANETSWMYSGTFVLSHSLAAMRHIELVSLGIDAVAVVSLNGQLLWNQSDAFRVMVADVSFLDRSNPNVLRVVIQSPLRAAAAARESCTGFCPSGAHDGNASAVFSDFNYIRKPAVGFGWDFAPNFATSGIWGRDLYLRGYSSAVYEEVTVVTTPTSPSPPVPVSGTSPWAVAFTVYVAAIMSDTPVTATVTVSGLSCDIPSNSTTLRAGDSAISVSGICEGVQAWWPAALTGVPPTHYNATVTITSGSDVSGTVFELGFRTSSLRNPAAPDNDGNLFYFEVNGRPLFIKGANWVPVDAFPSRGEALRNLQPKLDSFIAAGFNTLRVWGGGYPPSDDFYQACSRAGLLLWQEFPFACAGYPTYPSILADIAAETRDIVRRVQKYPILLWSGSNEVQSSQSYKPGSAGAGNFSSLFFGAVRDTLVTVDASRPFLVSSPASFTETEANPVVYPPQSNTRGDMHEYQYQENCWDPETYPRGRAVSEFGWQSHSSLPSYAELITPAQWNYWSASVSRRDTHGAEQPQVIIWKNVGDNWLIPGYNGSSKIAGNARDRRLSGSALAAATAARAANMTSMAYTRRADGSYAIPTDALGIEGMFSAFGGPGLAAGTTFRDTLFMTQVSQAQCVKTEAEKHRRIQSECIPGGGGGCTMVSMYWMAADPWPAATKGGLEWSGRWKVLHYTAQRMYAPFLLSPWTKPSADPSSAPFGVYVAAHPPAAPHPIPSGLLRIQCWAWDGTGLAGQLDIPFSVSEWPTPAALGAGAAATSGGALSVYEPPNLRTALDGCGCTGPATDCVMFLSAFNASSADPAHLLGTNTLYPAPLKSVKNLADPGLSITDVTGLGGGAFAVTVAAARLPAAVVWLESLLCCGHFSDNGFLMTASPLVLTYTPSPDSRGWAHAPPPGSETNVTAGQFAASLSVWSLYDTAGY